MTLLPTPALAVSAVAEIVGGAQYATVQEAINAAADGATVRLLDNVTLQPAAGPPYTLTIIAKNLTIDLNGKTIEGKGPDAINFLATKDYDLTITDSSALGGGMIRSEYSYPIFSTGNVTILGGTVQCSAAPVIYTASTCTVTVSSGTVLHTGGASTIISDNVNVKGGEVLNAGGGFAISAGSNVEVSGGTVQNNGDAPVIGGTTVKVTGGTVLGNGNAPVINATTVEVNVGTVENIGSGSTINAASAVTVEGGSVKSANSPAIASINVTVRGGTVLSSGTIPAISCTDVTVEGGKVVSGGAAPTISTTNNATVSGGTVLNTGTGYAIGSNNVTISGGSINSMSLTTPKNAATPADDVKLYTLTLAGISKETAVSSITLTPALGYAYGLTGVLTDASGNLYVWLPDAQKEASVSVTANGTTYAGTISGYSATLTAVYTPSTPSYIAPPANTVNATLGASNTANANIPDDVVGSALKKALDDAAAQGKPAYVTINVNVPQGTSSLSASLSQNALESLINAGVGSLTINTNGSMPSVTLGLKALKAMQKQSSGDVTLTFNAPSKLSKYARKVIGDRPVFGVSASYIKRGKVRSMSRLSGAGFVSILYRLLPGEAAEHLFGVMIDSKGNTTRVKGSYYDAASGYLIIPIKSISAMYGVGYRAGR